MKKLLTCILSLLLLLALLAGCGSGKDDAVTETTPTPDAAPEATVEPTPDPTPEATPETTPEATPEAAPDPTPEQPAETSGIDLAGFIDGLADKYEMPMMGPMDSEMLGAFYPGLTDISLEQCEGQMAMMSAVAAEIVLVQCANESDAAAVAEIFEERKTMQVDGGAWYPETIAAWEKTQIVTNGAYVALICFGDNTEAITADYNALF